MTKERAKKMTLIVNTVILFLVFGLWGFFWLFKVTFLVYFSIPTTLIYLIGYVLIWKNKLNVYVWIVYLWLTLYMGVTTVCLGYNYGFHLYCMSMVPIMFVTEYLAYKLHQKSLRALDISIVVVLFDLACTGFIAFAGPLYERDQFVAGFFWIINSLTVFGFLIFYSSFLVKLVIQSENKLSDLAHKDRLTGLYNRHYMIEQLENIKNSESKPTLAMLDIDFFKKINDTYGHNAGDFVLKTLSDFISEQRPECTVSRWGGEEFLILSDKSLEEEAEAFEKLRKLVESTPFEFEGNTLHITVTVGLASKRENEPIDQWVDHADDLLYYGKNNGRNQVISREPDRA